MVRHAVRRWVEACAIGLLVSGSAWGHPSVDERLKALGPAGGAACRADVLMRRGGVLRAEGRLDEALAEFEQAASCDAEVEGIDLARAQVLLEAKLPRAAIVAVERWLVTHAQRGEGLLVRARARAALGRWAEAAADWAEAVGALRAPQPDHFVDWSRAAEQGGDLDGAVAALDEGMRRLGVIPVLSREAARIDAGRGRTDAALGRIDRAMQVLPPRFEWLRLRGEVLEAAGRKAEAAAAYGEALAEVAKGARRTAAIVEIERAVKAGIARTRAGTGPKARRSTPRP